MQHVNIKIFAREAAIDIEKAIPVFHRWIQDNVCEELVIDVADYKHVPDGPGVMLIGHEADYSLDESKGRLGLLYNRKIASGESDAQSALAQAYNAALGACKRLEEDPAFLGKLRFDAGDCEVIVNDRLLAPNTDATWEALGPEIKKFFGTVYGPVAFEIERRGEPRERFRVGVKASAPVEV